MPLPDIQGNNHMFTNSEALKLIPFEFLWRLQYIGMIN